MGLLTSLRNAKREHEAQKAQDNPGFRLTLNDESPVHLATSEIIMMSDKEIDNNYQVIGRGKDGMLIVRRK